MTIGTTSDAVSPTGLSTAAPPVDLDRWVDGGMLVRLKDEAHTELPVGHDRVSGLKERLGL